MKKKTTSFIEEQLQRLNRSPLFAISLSGKELSHSNFGHGYSNKKSKENIHLSKYLSLIFIKMDVPSSQSNEKRNMWI